MKARIIFILLLLFAAPSYGAELPAAAAPAAQHGNLASMYFWGWGVKRDYAQAMSLWLKAAGAGDPVAVFNIGEMYEDGWGVKRDYAEAIKWFRRAAYMGNPNAERNIGEAYSGGFGVKQDPAEAAKWYRQAAAQGDYIAQLSIGGMYARGEGGLKQDAVQAYMWLDLAAKAKITTPADEAPALVETFDSSIGLYAARQRDALAAKMAPADIAEAQRLVAAWKPSTFQPPSAAALAAHAFEESDAAVTFHDYQAALQLLAPLALQGNARAQEKIGTLYANGQDGANRNYPVAMQWFQKAAAQNYARAQVDIGWMYENGWGVQRDYTEAVKWFRKAAELGDAVAQRNIGVVYGGGWAGVQQDLAEAGKWYRKAADQGDFAAQFEIGGMYARGTGGLPQDNVQAYMWFSVAAAAARNMPQNAFSIVETYDSSIIDYAAKQRDVVAQKMTPAQIAQAQQLAAAWKPASNGGGEK